MGFKILRGFENVDPYMHNRFFQVVGNGVKGAEFQTVQKEDVGC